MSRAKWGPRGAAPTRRSFLALGVAAGALRLHATPSVELDARELLDVPNSYRMRMHWFIFGPAWSAEECERELQLMAAAHIGGVLIFPAYPIARDDPAPSQRSGHRASTSPSARYRRRGKTARGILRRPQRIRAVAHRERRQRRDAARRQR